MNTSRKRRRRDADIRSAAAARRRRRTALVCTQHGTSTLAQLARYEVLAILKMLRVSPDRLPPAATVCSYASNRCCFQSTFILSTLWCSRSACFHQVQYADPDSWFSSHVDQMRTFFSAEQLSTITNFLSGLLRFLMRLHYAMTVQTTFAEFSPFNFTRLQFIRSKLIIF